MEIIDPIVTLIIIFVLACMVGYYVIWGVTSALHSPWMAVTNAISSVIIVGAIIAAGPEEQNFSSIMGFLAIILASINIFGGFVVSHRMLSMFKKKEKKLSYIKKYILTPKGIDFRIKLTIQFMKRKMKEYDELKSEIEEKN